MPKNNYSKYIYRIEAVVDSPRSKFEDQRVKDIYAGSGTFESKVQTAISYVQGERLKAS